ncbi:hypothetical protein EMIT0P12_21202 [Pseudomonas sp. IT-P12]
MPPSNKVILPLTLSPFFNQTVSASKGVEAPRTARHSRVLETISKTIAQSCGKIGIIRRNKTLATTDPTISIEFISQLPIEDLLYGRYCPDAGASLPR